MDRQFFMEELARRLSVLPPSEREAALGFYTELLDEAGVENERKVLEELGSPYQVAAKILAEFAADQTLGRESATGGGGPYASGSPRRRISWLWYLLLGILAAPVALPAAVAAIAAVVGMLVALGVVLVAVGAGFVGWAGAGVGLFIAGIYSMAVFPAGSITLIGLSLMMTAVTLLVFIPLRYVVECMIDLVVRGAAYAFNKLTGGAAR